ncbi:MAG: zf-TFIIB domain-containing protein [Planctomycetota bacterium]
MNARTILCPSCGQSLTIPTQLRHIRCPKCGGTFDTTQIGKDAPTKREQADESVGRERQKMPVNAVIAIVAVLAIALTLVPVSIGFFRLGQVGVPAQQSDEDTAFTSSSDSANEFEEVEFREVKKVAESTRKQIYSQLQMTKKSSVDRAIPLPKDSPMRRSLESTLEGAYARERVHQALLHGLEEDDIDQILLEGTIKGW